MLRLRAQLLFPLVFLFISLSGCYLLNRYEKEGTLVLKGLKAPVTVLRDEKGMAYIYADNIHDAIMAQGFVTAQDRLFQMELTRLFATGRISELIGKDGIGLDTRMRTIGFYRNAKKYAGLLDDSTRRFFQAYVDGVNAYIQDRKDSHPLEFKLAGLKPTPWSIADSLSILYYMSWDTSANLHTEIITQMLLETVGLEKAQEIFPLNINPDDELETAGNAWRHATPWARLHLAGDEKLLSYLQGGTLCIGSNNWSVAPERTKTGKPIVANDPHLDARILPGPWYPCGLLGPDFRAVGVMVPGMPGVVIGRTSHIALGITDAYGDTQDLYVETLDPEDPERYMEGDRSVPFEIVQESLKIKDKEAPGGYGEVRLEIKLTRRGPVISGVLAGLKTDKVLSVRWAPFEVMDPKIGLEDLLRARSVKEAREGLKHVNMIAFNFVFADKDGNIGWQTSGRLPVRSRGDGTVPYVVRDGEDNWSDWIPFDQMPCQYNPPRGWVGTCNHRTVAQTYPYYYSSCAAPSYRYRRLKQLMGDPGAKAAEDHYAWQRDTVNLMAKEIAPLMAKALSAHEDTDEIGRILSTWNFRDDPDMAAPAIFQAVYGKFALLVFQDELGEDLARTMLENWYFWEERLQKMVLDGVSPWFDDIKTGGIRETRDGLFHRAAVEVVETLGSFLGKEPNKWKWGEVHKIEFLSPIRRQGLGKGLLGGSHRAPGSAETLCRGIYEFNDPFGVTVFASLRMVADLGDHDKVLAVLPGGVSGRLFDSHHKDQIAPFMEGDKVYWWLSDKAIKAHAKTTLFLKPE
jgi:penicillin amidase